MLQSWLTCCPGLSNVYSRERFFAECESGSPRHRFWSFFAVASCKPGPLVRLMRLRLLLEFLVPRGCLFCVYICHESVPPFVVEVVLPSHGRRIGEHQRQ